MIYLGIDFGQKKIGLAVGNDISATARPLEVFYYEDLDHLMAFIFSRVEQWQIGAFVVGDPGPQHHAPEYEEDFARFVSRLKGESGRSVFLHSEYLTSQEATRRLRDGEKGAKDSIAAQIILESYLSSFSVDHYD